MCANKDNVLECVVQFDRTKNFAQKVHTAELTTEVSPVSNKPSSSSILLAIQLHTNYGEYKFVIIIIEVIFAFTRLIKQMLEVKSSGLVTNAEKVRSENRRFLKVLIKIRLSKT